MADIAKLGFSVNTSELDKGAVALDKFKTSAQSANGNIKGMGTAMTQSAKIFASAVAGMNRGIYAMVSATKGATVEQIKLAKESSNFANSVYKSIAAQEKFAASTNKATAAIKGESAALNQLDLSQDRLSKLRTVQDIRPTARPAIQEARAVSKFNVGNIAAQFQDIGITAAMGQSPLTVAIQQGTQLSAIINSMESPLAGLKQAFISILNPISLMSIGITGIVVALIQTVNWSKVGTGILNAMASGMDVLADNTDNLVIAVLALGTALLITNRTAIATFIVGIAKAGTAALVACGQIAAGWLIAMGPVGWVIAGVTAVIVAFNGFFETVKYIFDGVKDVLNKMTGLFVGFFRVVIESAGWYKDQLKNILTGSFDEVESLSSRLGNSFQDALNTDYIGGAADKISSGFRKAADALRSYGTEVDVAGKATKKLNDEMVKEDPWTKITSGVKDSIAQLQLQKDVLGKNVYETTLLTQKYELLKQAMDAGMTDSPELRSKIGVEAEKIAKMTEEVNVLTDSFEFSKNITKGFFSDMRQGLQDGIGAWEAFGNSVMNVMNKLIDKLFDVGIDLAFAGLTPMFSSMGKASAGAPAGGGMQTGGGFDNMFQFAKGGAFTNGVYNSPTPFAFAGGGAFGVMGEAGAEAVMPLSRGSDGSLGVRAEGGGSKVFVNVINNANAQTTVQQRETSQGTEIDVMIDQMVANNLNQQGSYSNKAINALGNRQMIRR